ncbi:hypothetical protein HHK36_031532 [Tetracentron sinense]|uniref:GH18 domain-containing protein n=1 Tax=Tetracentron sinense TaxID=13715 RepID=A0A834Y9G3_TETSI|nr:hypothetical protein HHK36_031532 [Tetracentron sinense]
MADQKLVLLFLATIFYPIVAGATISASRASFSAPAPSSYPPESGSPIPAPISPSPAPLTRAESKVPTGLHVKLTVNLLLLSLPPTLHAKNPPAKAFLSIGGGNASPYTFSNLASSLSNRASFIKSTIEVARKYGFDGLDLDWEFPVTQQDMSNLSTLFAEWRTTVEKEASTTGRPRILLSAAVYFASYFLLTDVSLTYPGDAIRDFCRFVSPMCFDYHGGWNTTVSGEHALLYDATSNISTSYGIQSWIKASVPAKKLVMGLPLYGWTWQLKDPSVNGIGAPAVGTGPGILGIMHYNDLVDFNVENNAIEVYDEKTVSMYSYSGTNWIGHDGTRSIKSKVEFARAHGKAEITYQSGIRAMSTHKDRIEKLESDVQDIEDAVQRMTQGSEVRMQQMERSIKETMERSVKEMQDANSKSLGEQSCNGGKDTGSSSHNGGYRDYRNDGQPKRHLKMDFPRFSGDNPNVWLNRANQFFDFQQTSEEEKVP